MYSPPQPGSQVAATGHAVKTSAQFRQPFTPSFRAKRPAPASPSRRLEAGCREGQGVRLSLHPNTKRHAPRNARRNFSPGADCASQALTQTTLTGRKKTLQAPIRPKRSRPNCAKLSVNSPPKSMEEPRRHVHPHRSRCGRADLRLRCGSPSFSRGRRRTRTGSSRLHPGRLGRCRRWCRPAGTPASSSTAI